MNQCVCFWLVLIGLHFLNPLVLPWTRVLGWSLVILGIGIYRLGTREG